MSKIQNGTKHEGPMTLARFRQLMKGRQVMVRVKNSDYYVRTMHVDARDVFRDAEGKVVIVLDYPMPALGSKRPLLWLDVLP